MQVNMNIPRRALLQGATVVGATALMGSVLGRSEDVAYAQSDDNIQNQDNTQYGFLIKASNCVNCQQCVEACRHASNTPEEVEARRQIKHCKTASKQDVFVSVSCMHCENPACMSVCPARAICKGEGGVVAVDLDRCIGCKYCYQACPFEVPRYTTSGMDKCDCCLGAGIELGKTPNCVKACKFHALHYGVIDELMAGSGGAAHRIESSTEPSYLLQ